MVIAVFPSTGHVKKEGLDITSPSEPPPPPAKTMPVCFLTTIHATQHLAIRSIQSITKHFPEALVLVFATIMRLTQALGLQFLSVSLKARRMFQILVIQKQYQHIFPNLTL